MHTDNPHCGNSKPCRSTCWKTVWSWQAAPFPGCKLSQCTCTSSRLLCRWDTETRVTSSLSAIYPPFVQSPVTPPHTHSHTQRTWCYKVGSLSTTAVRQSILGKPQPRQVTVTRARNCRAARDITRRALLAAPSFPVSALSKSSQLVAVGPEVSNTATRTARSLRVQTERQRNEQGKPSMLSQLHAANFARICIDVHVQVLRDRVVANLAKLLSRWRTTVIQDGAEFCIRSIAWLL